MNDIWEALLAARENGIEEKELRFLAARKRHFVLEVQILDYFWNENMI